MTQSIFSPIVATTLLLGCVVAYAQQTPAPPSPAPAPATTLPTTQTSSAATAWKLDDTHSMAMFRIQHFGAGMFWGRFDGVTGTITTSGATPETLALNVTIDTNSVSTANKDLDGHLRSPDFFSVKEFPDMKFVSTSAKKMKGNLWEVSGDLTLHGITKPIVAALEFTGQTESARGKKIGFEAMFTIDRTDFGMNYGIEKNSIGKSVSIIVGLEGTSS